VSSKESHRERRTARPRRRPERVAIEALEPRQLMTFSPFGFSLPDLTVTGYSAPTAAWGGSLTLDVNVLNTGASSLIEPTHLPPGVIGTANTQGASNANSPPTTVEVFASTTPDAKSGLVRIDTVDIPAISQNSNSEIISTIPLPARPAGFPGNGGKIFLTYVVNNTRAFTEASFANNVFRVPTPVTITDPLPDLQVVAFNLPSTLQPGDVIAPTVRIANFGSANPAAQGPVTVDLVASLNDTFGPGDAVVASYVISSLPGSSGVPTLGSIADDANVIPTPNENTTTVPAFQLPTTPGTYFLGIEIDPFHTINQTYAPNPKLRDVVTVGPPSPFLPAGNLLFPTSTFAPFPAAPSTFIAPAASATATLLPLVSSSTNTSRTAFVLNSSGLVSAKSVHVKPTHVTSHAQPHKASSPKAKH
jgi:hypothetical protein